MAFRTGLRRTTSRRPVLVPVGRSVGIDRVGLAPKANPPRTARPSHASSGSYTDPQVKSGGGMIQEVLGVGTRLEVSSHAKLGAMDLQMIETARLWLRPMRWEDVDALLTIFGDPKVMAAFSSEPFGKPEMARWVERNLAHQQRHGYGLFSVVHKDEGQIIGDCGLEHRDIRGGRRSSWATIFAAPIGGVGLRRRLQERCVITRSEI